ncbi:hypothetical protein Lfu02_71050 [Longispora fulva]|nr:hypothetical protein Lfu02_71050 [Longispora fulva]
MALLPVPVAPNSTECSSPRRTLAASSAIAVGWSPAGLYSLTTSKRPDARGMSSAIEPTVRARYDNPDLRCANKAQKHCAPKIPGLASIVQQAVAAFPGG